MIVSPRVFLAFVKWQLSVTENHWVFFSSNTSGSDTETPCDLGEVTYPLLITTVLIGKVVMIMAGLPGMLDDINDQTQSCVHEQYPPSLTGKFNIKIIFQIHRGDPLR